HINGFASDAGRLEGNANVRWKLSEHLGSVLFLHASRQKKEFDMNMDGFLDEPLVEQINLMNRWEYEVHGKRHHQLGFKVLDEQREAGQSAALEHFHSSEDSIYRIDIGTRRYELFSKNGFIFSRPGTSLGILASATYHEHNSLFGRSFFYARQTSIYLNAIFETFIGNTRHKLASGASMSHDDYSEDFRTLETDRQEMVPGVFAEYSYSPGDKLTLLVGMRVDNHNLYGTFFTPRAHLRWTPYEHTVLRASAGKGYRTPYLVAENSWIMASSRQLIIEEKPDQEEAWNYGINITQYVDILGRELRLSLDAYRTDFLNQLIVDLDRSQDRIFVYNLKGRSYSNSIQAEAQYELLRGLELTAAFRINDVRTTTNDKLQEQLLVNRYKGLVSMSWQSAMKRWQADLTTQFNGSARLPSTQLSPEIYQRTERSKAHTILLGQVTRYFKTWSIYIGGENLLNYKQKDPIIAADQPYGPWFDAASVWGPVHGRKIYAGFRYTLK
ncbi:MAG: TonB-dependent receptor, partial [Bacteroidales bacterium]|nr:TonB-dependent receptor [Bacteroidales bacterium]